MNINFEHLELLPKLLRELYNLSKEVDEIKIKLSKSVDLSKRSGVREFLNVSDSTIAVMMNDGRLKQNIHYVKELKGNKSKITFIESAIRELKKDIA